MSILRSVDERHNASRLELALIIVLVVAAIGAELFVRSIRFVLRRKP